MARFEDFTPDQRNVFDEALSAYTDYVIEDDDFYDEEDKHKLMVLRTNLLNELRQIK